MATSLNGADVLLYIKHATYTEDEWKVAVCSIQHTLSETKAESTVITKCGAMTAAGTDDNSISLDLTFLTSAPLTGEVAAETLIEMYRSGATFEWLIADTFPSPQYVSDYGNGVMTSCTSSYPAEGMVNVALEIKCNGTITGQYTM